MMEDIFKFISYMSAIAIVSGMAVFIWMLIIDGMCL